ncbi:9359_t:CDS:2, partial [Entrophospora sp. SA101]
MNRALAKLDLLTNRVIINYIEKELGISSLTWIINFPSDVGNLINEKFPLKSYLNYLNDIKEDDNSSLYYHPLWTRSK